MTSKDIANILFNLSSDMDFNIEYFDDEIEALAKDIDRAGRNLRYALEDLASKNLFAKDLHNSLA